MNISIIAATLALALGSNAAHAAPSLFAYGDINQATLEDFQSDFGAIPSPVSFAGFQYTASSPVIIGNAQRTAWCNADGADDPDLCLINSSPIEGARVFDGFGSGTTAFGLDLNKLREGDDIQATVVGVSGTSVFTDLASGLLGFLDPLGLTSVTIVNNGRTVENGGTARGNYSFDDVITGTTVVPLPAGLPLLVGGLLALGMMRRRASAAG